MQSELKKPYIIPIFIPHAACPHRCVFCSQVQITGSTEGIPTADAMQNIILSHLNHQPESRSETQVSFYGGNFLGLSGDRIKRLLGVVRPFIDSGRVDAVRCSTRPDTVVSEVLELIRPFPVSTIELGAQSMDDGVLSLSNRGHTAHDTKNAVQVLKQNGYHIGIQMMVGLPGETEGSAVETARKIIDLAPDFVRIYPTIVLSGSILSVWHEQGKYVPMTLNRCVSLVKKIFLEFRTNQIPVIRMGLQPTPELQKEGVVRGGPFHPAFGHLVHSRIYLDRVLETISWGKPMGGDLTLHVHPKDESILRGIGNHNLRLLSGQQATNRLAVVSDSTLDRETIRVNGRLVHIFSKQPKIFYENKKND
jgi:histone acetyltransferase (RNA polymerase elongator complex component)